MRGTSETATRGVMPALLLLALAACSGAAAPPAASVAAAEVRAGFPAHGIMNTITIDATDRLPLRAATLVAPDGSTTAASYINNDVAPRNAGGQWGAFNSWQNAVTDNNAFAAATGDAAAGAAVRADTQLNAVVSTADIPLTDPVAYRRDWQRYRIRLSFGTPPGMVESQEIAAPEPPDAAPR